MTAFSCLGITAPALNLAGYLPNHLNTFFQGYVFRYRCFVSNSFYRFIYLRILRGMFGRYGSSCFAKIPIYDCLFFDDVDKDLAALITYCEMQ